MDNIFYLKSVNIPNFYKNNKHKLDWEIFYNIMSSKKQNNIVKKQLNEIIDPFKDHKVDTTVLTPKYYIETCKSLTQGEKELNIVNKCFDEFYCIL